MITTNHSPIMMIRPFRGQLLTDHLMTVGVSGRTGEVIGMGSMSKLIGLLHDLGKCSREFQAYIRGNIKRGLTILPPAQSSWIKWRRKFGQIMILIIFLSLDESARYMASIQEIVQYPILAHHGLYDIIDNKFDYHTGIRLAYAGETEKNIHAKWKIILILLTLSMSIRQVNLYTIPIMKDLLNS